MLHIEKVSAMLHSIVVSSSGRSVGIKGGQKCGLLNGLIEDLIVYNLNQPLLKDNSTKRTSSHYITEETWYNLFTMQWQDAHKIEMEQGTRDETRALKQKLLCTKKQSGHLNLTAGAQE